MHLDSSHAATSVEAIIHAYAHTNALPALEDMVAGPTGSQSVNGKIRQVRFPVYVAITHLTLQE
jgi:hypothetical protein